VLFLVGRVLITVLIPLFLADILYPIGSILVGHQFLDFPIYWQITFQNIP
jgi:hypothetical protein